MSLDPATAAAPGHGSAASTSHSISIPSSHAPSASLSAISTSQHAPTRRSPSPSPSLSGSAAPPLTLATSLPISATSSSTTTTTATSSDEILSMRSLKQHQRDKERERDRSHKHRHRSRDERKEEDESRRARRERRENETPEERAARRAERHARRAAREAKKNSTHILPRSHTRHSQDMEMMPMGSGEHKTAPPASSIISPASSDDDAAPAETGDAPEVASDNEDNVLERPLIYYKRSNPVRQRTTKEEGPVQIVFPGNVMCLGESPLKPSRDTPTEHEHLVVFSSPNDDQVSRTKVFACLLIFLLPADFILISTIYFQGDMIDDTSGSQSLTDALTYACTIMALVLGFVGMRLKDTRILTIFIVVFYIDAVLNLIRIYTILQFSHFIIQLAIGHVMTQYKQTLTGSWFAPVN